MKLRLSLFLLCMVVSIYFVLVLCFIATEINPSWNELYIFFKYCTEIINCLPYEYYHITDSILNDLMVRFYAFINLNFVKYKLTVGKRTKSLD